MLIHGFHSVAARLKRGGEGITELYVAIGRDDPRLRDLVRLAERAGIRPSQVDVARLDRLAPGRRHQGVVMIAESAVPVADLDELLDRVDKPMLLLLDGVTDPRNLGACLRVADGAGAHAVVAPKDHACPLTDVAIQTASGAAESVPYVMVTNLARTIEDLQERGVWVIGTADEAPASLYDHAIPASVAWVLGAEGKGLRRLVRERCDALVNIPMAGQVSSLNVSVAAGIVLYETVRQTRSGRAVDAG
ncbi:MAG TPA: 23S rRNA (guanosine(2251)-2'-O)-methyltransferase RlmB [Quisquiliibacterium sp.]|nr:23S rRNA (guanosine(2251)-2'-O)-methyltransferase RlmB [Quisquiliibacterium sp.]